MRTFFRIIGHFLIILVLTLVTQIGGLIWLISILISHKTKWKKRIVFPVIYLSFNLLVIPFTAPLFGREQLPVFESQLKPHNYFYVLSFRNYVTPQLKTSIKKTAEDVSKDGISISYLDANFPFWDGFLLLPHLSHNDGQKIDIAFMYKTKDGQKTDKNPSLFGYGVFTDSKNPTVNYCKQNCYWQYDVTKYLGVNTNKDLILDTDKTRALIKALLHRSNNSKIFIEPHLKQELGLQNYSQVRFHGCQAVRHDDHIHFEVKQTFNNY